MSRVIALAVFLAKWGFSFVQAVISRVDTDRKLFSLFLFKSDAEFLQVSRKKGLEIGGNAIIIDK